MTNEIESEKVFETAMTHIRSARMSVKMTMRAAEESDRPLPPEYFALLQDTMRSGVSVTRIGFGSAAEFMRLADSVYVNDPHYAFIRADDDGYRRMLLVDDARLMYSIKEAHGRRFFYTEDPAIVAEYKDYFSQHAHPTPSMLFEK